MNEDQLWDLSDDDLETAYKEAVATGNSPDTDLETEDVSITENVDDSEISNEDTDEVLDEGTEEEEDGQDQPEDTLEESDHDSSDEADDTDVDEDDTTDDTEDDPDGDSEESDEESSEDTEVKDGEEQPAKSYSFKANGKDYEFSSEEIVDQFPKIFGKAMDYTKKMQAIKPWRKTIDALEGADLSHKDVSLMIDVLKGDKEAITEVLKRTGTDTLELDTEADSGYTTKDYGRDAGALAISDIVDEISQDAEYATTHNILSKEWDEKSWETMSENPEMIRLLHTDVKSGLYKTLQPIAEKLKVYDSGNKGDLEYYKEAAQQHFAKTAKHEAFKERQDTKQQEQKVIDDEAENAKSRVTEAKAQSSKRSATKKASAKRKAAAPTRTAATGRDVVDYLEESDEAFDEWYNKLQNSM